MTEPANSTMGIPSNPRPVLRFHEENRLVRSVALDARESLDCDGATWRCDVTGTDVPGRPGTRDLEVTFQLVSGSATGVAVGIEFGFADWAEENYVLLPAAVYRGNHFKVSEIPYPPLWRDKADFRLDMPVTITPAPRLGGDSHRIEQTTGDTASPTMGFYSPSGKMGFLVQTEQGSRFGNHGLTVETLAGHREACFRITAPAVRVFRQDHCKAVPSDDRGASWQAGDSLTLRARVVVFPAPELQELFERYGEIRKDLNPAAPTCGLPFSAARRLVEEKWNRDNWLDGPGYYKLAPNDHTTFVTEENPLCFLWQIGWVGGGMVTLPLLADGGETSRERSWRNLEMIFARTRAPSGFFYGIGDGVNFFSDGFDRPHPHNLHMVRKSGDWLYFAIRHFDLFAKLGKDIPPEWEAAIRGLADAFVKLWDRYGQFGQYVDVETGDLLIGGSTAGAIVPGALTLASAWFKDPRMLEVAEAAARQYQDEILATGITTGGPGEILSAPDSESVFAMIESLVTLMEITGDNAWAQDARALARHAATWVVAYDYVFPPRSTLGRSGAHSCGAVFANIQNKHGAPGICTWSGDSLFRLWRATGDPLALDLVRDIAHGITQYVSLADAPLSETMRPGWMCERVNLSDWESANGVGGQIFGSSSWPETSLLLTCQQIPGLYVQPDSGFVCVFDHITVQARQHTAAGLELVLHNPTRYDAAVKVLSEDAAGRSVPLALNALADARVLDIPAGGTITAIFARNQTDNPIQRP